MLLVGGRQQALQDGLQEALRHLAGLLQQHAQQLQQHMRPTHSDIMHDTQTKDLRVGRGARSAHLQDGGLDGLRIVLTAGEVTAHFIGSERRLVHGLLHPE